MKSFSSTQMLQGYQFCFQQGEVSEKVFSSAGRPQTMNNSRGTREPPQSIRVPHVWLDQRQSLPTQDAISEINCAWRAVFTPFNSL
jgi:hypothetical protein